MDLNQNEDQKESGVASGVIMQCECKKEEECGEKHIWYKVVKDLVTGSVRTIEGSYATSQQYAKNTEMDTKYRVHFSLR